MKNYLEFIVFRKNRMNETLHFTYSFIAAIIVIFSYYTFSIANNQINKIENIPSNNEISINNHMESLSCAYSSKNISGNYNGMLKGSVYQPGVNSFLIVSERNFKAYTAAIFDMPDWLMILTLGILQILLVLYIHIQIFKKNKLKIEYIVNQKNRHFELKLREKEKKEEVIRESRDKLNFFLEGSKDGFWNWDISADKIIFNENAANIFQCEFTSLPKKLSEWHAKIHNKDRCSTREVLDRYLQSDSGFFEAEYRLITGKGTCIWVFDRGKIVECDVQGKPIRMAGSLTDITERKKHEEELLKVKKIESIGLLAGGIAHDFNNLLTIILGNISLMRIKIQRNDTNGLLNLVENTEKASFRAKDLTHQLMTYSKNATPIIKTISISNLLIEATTFSLRGSNVKSHFDIPDDLWLIEADEGQINQVVQNIVINARQAMPAGGNIFISASNCVIENEQDNYASLKNGKHVKIKIKDSGNGISKENITKIFDPYFTTKEKGHGLGLFTTYSIIKKHEGDIKISSLPGEGAEFTFWIPASMTNSISIASKEGIEKGSGKILIMDDELLIRNLLSELLSSLGYQVKSTENGDETIAEYKKSILENEPFDLVIIDLTIPGGMGGVETTTELKKIYPAVRTLVSTGYSNDPVVSKYSDYLFDGVLNKPY